jgi:tetratricopeptide (TPR) repeat protein
MGERIMSSLRKAVNTFAAAPDPGQAGTLDELAERLRRLKVWAGDPSFECVKDRINAAWTAMGRPAGELVGKTTVVDCFRTGRRRMNAELVVAVVQALHPDAGYVAQWRQALRVVGGETQAAAQVRVQDRLPQNLVGFTGRTAELGQLRRALNRGYHDGAAVVVAAIEGMAGVGKTQLAIHAAHVLAREQPLDRVLFVDLRGFHPDPAQPPADPAAVLDGFLCLLGVPGQQIPHDLDARAAAYRDRLAGSNTLVILDNAAEVDQVRPLLPATTGCLTLVTSRRSLAGLDNTTHLVVDVFTPVEAVLFLTRAAARVSAGTDLRAPARIARRCGYLPLALGLVAAQVRSTPGWTLTDHADRLDERHRNRRLDTGVELALDLSYQHLPSGPQRLLRLLALHPGQDFDIYAASALADADLPAVRTHLYALYRDHLLQQLVPGRFSFHDLVRAHAVNRAVDEERPADRRTALTRLLDYYLAAAARAVNTLFPADMQHRPRIPSPSTPTPTLSDLNTARHWLDRERPALVAVSGHSVAHGWPTHAIRLSATLFRYLAGGHFADALIMHGHARDAARRTDDSTGQAHALADLAGTYIQMGRFRHAADHLYQALRLFRHTGDHTGQARALINLGIVEERRGSYRSATDHCQQALTLFRQTGDRVREASALSTLGEIEARLGHCLPAAEHQEQALTLFRQAGDRVREANVLTNLGDIEARLGRYGPAAKHLQQALTLCRHLGDLDGEAWTMNALGNLHTHLGQPDQATEHHRQALTIFREIGGRDGEAQALNGLGEAAHTAGRCADALTYHTDAIAIATDTGAPDQQARAHTGLGHAHHALGDTDSARRHYQHALTLYADLDMPEVDEIRGHLTRISTLRT